MRQGYWTGKKRSEETRKKISEVQKGRKQPQETIEKRRIANRKHGKGRQSYNYEEWRRQILERDGGIIRPQVRRVGGDSSLWAARLQSAIRDPQSAIYRTTPRKAAAPPPPATPSAAGCSPSARRKPSAPPQSAAAWRAGEVEPRTVSKCRD